MCLCSLGLWFFPQPKGAALRAPEGSFRANVYQHLLEDLFLCVLILPHVACGLFIWGQGGQRAWLCSNPDPPQDAESCYLIRALLKFYLTTVFKNYLDKAADSRIRKSFSTLANNFFVIVSKLQPSVSRTTL